MNLLSASQFEMQKLWDRKQDDPNVENDVDDCVSPSKRIEVHALALCFTRPACPGIRDWNALDRNAEGESGNVKSADRHAADDQSSKGLRWENPVVKEQQGHLCETNHTHVKDFGQPGKLKCSR